MYFTICYMIMFGVISSNSETFEDVTTIEIVLFIFSPIVAPIFVGFCLNSKK